MFFFVGMHGCGLIPDKVKNTRAITIRFKGKKNPYGNVTIVL